MAKLDDFDLDIVVKKQDNIVQPNITSKSLLYPGLHHRHLNVLNAKFLCIL
ncbi:MULTISPECIES: gallidermin/nisin family lantibiotic [Geobacillus]|uniref:Lantibiotic n=1 Tax=Geobacillus kaustophilus (strain HTA426) TaxID=235909 RepID=Q5L3A1_GEOKA|nr:MULTISPECIES: gallidermin/nisin family lantibiotic [Geobacillus]MED3667652.1 gallidermin/nisin family lantibiotic [Geobacillus kaustophilus]MED4973233.1 gallidermin/nisin family lantibiotic [Geobacillus thermoleovorans]BAD74579.1 lantibiotic precursor [Geobacillus kaustophilus HTA426]